jgi:integrase
MSNAIATIAAASEVAALSQDQVALRLEEYARLSEGAFSANTQRAVASDTRIFTAWCADHGYHAGPPSTPEAVAAFVDAQAAIKAPATVGRYVSSIDHLHRAIRVLPVGPSNPVKMALRRMRRAKGTDQAQAAPMRRSDIEAALGRMGPSLIELRDAALLSLAYDSLARASELVALNVSDVQHGGNGATVYIARSKTDQEGAGQYRFVAPDTFARVMAWVAAARLDPAAPLFIPMSHAGAGDRITPRDVSRIYQRRVGKGFSAHSTRVGNAVEQREAGIPTGAIAQSGGWKGEAMPARYTRKAAAQESGAARLARSQGRA